MESQEKKEENLPEFDEYLSPNEIGKYLHLSRYSVLKLIRTGQLPAVRVLSSIRIKKSDFKKYLESRTTEKVYPDGGDPDETITGT